VYVIGRALNQYNQLNTKKRNCDNDKIK
jgi:hypothetical protein